MKEPLDPGEIVRRRATGAARTGLRREAAVLGEHRQPGVVELVDLVDTDDETVLVTRRVGRRTLADAGPLTVAQAAGVVAATAVIVADLHRTGLVHGRLEPSRVLLTPSGRPVLCGFADAGPAGTPLPESDFPPEPWLDPAARRDGERAASTDVYALGAIMHTLLEPGRPPAGSWLDQRVGAEARARRRLRRIAASARRSEPRLRPSARALAAAITATVPAAELPAESVDDDRTRDAVRPWRTRPARPLPVAPRRRRVVTAAVGVLVLAAGAGWWLTTRAADPPPPAATLTAPVGAEPTPRPCRPGPGVVCADRVDIRSGVVDTGGVRYAVGDPSDLVVVGDWDCDGNATAALLRPSTGEVFVFDRWARAGEELVVRPVVRLAGADRIDVLAAGTACHRLAVGHRGGRWVYDSSDA